MIDENGGEFASKTEVSCTVVVETALQIAAARFISSSLRTCAVAQAATTKEEEQTFESKGNETYEPERWSFIEEALRAPVTHVAVLNPFLPLAVQESARETYQLTDHEELPLVCDCPLSSSADRKVAAARAAATFVDDAEGQLPRPAALRAAREEPHKLLPCCFLSGASVIAAQALRVRPGEKVLDLCAGPGTKSLMLAAALFGCAGGEALSGDMGIGSLLEMVGAEAGLLPAAPTDGGLLVCNEPSRLRAAVLEGVLASFLPQSLLGGGRVVVTKAEGSERVPLALQRLGPFDKVLVDAPCSAARGKVGGRGTMGASEPELTTAKKNAALMEALLRCAGALVRPGGLVLYCTSSLEERENDEAVRKFLRRMGDSFELVPGADDAPIAGAEKTAYGTMILPDQGTLYGPLYFAQIRRVRA